MLAQQKKIPTLTKEQWQDIQGFVVYGYGILPYARYLFLHIEDLSKAKAWLSKLVEQITTVQQWYDHFDGNVAHNIAFTNKGVEAMRLSQSTLQTFSREFTQGVYQETRARLLGDIEDSAPEKWTVCNPKHNGTNEEVHMLLLLNANSKAALNTGMEHDLIQQLGKTVGEPSESGLYIVGDESGSTPASKKEPFGFRDGISNPWIANTRDLVLGQRKVVKERYGKEVEIGLEDDPVIKSGEFILGYENEYDQLASSPLVVNEADADLPEVDLPDMPSTVTSVKDFGRNGTYVVYRKLEQDREGFWTYMREQAEKLYGSADPDKMSWLSAKCVGRWSSGVPLAIAPDEDDPELAKKAVYERNNSLINNFHYINQGANDPIDDAVGTACPWGAHIRRNHPRDSLIDSMHNENIPARFSSSRQHRIMRRSVSWGKLADYQVNPPDFIENKGAPLEITFDHDHDYGSDEEGAGIHFFGINANIQRQFEFIMHAWSNDERFNGLFDNKDGIIGDSDEPTKDPSHMDIPRKDSYRLRLKNFPRFVHVRGASYLFMPGMAALRYMAK